MSVIRFANTKIISISYHYTAIILKSFTIWITTATFYVA